MPEQDKDHDRVHRGNPPGAPQARLKDPLPDQLEVGAGTALRLVGFIEPGAHALERLRVRLGGIEAGLDGVGPAPAELGRGALIWWVVLQVPAATELGPAPIALIAEGGGGAIELSLGEIQLERGRPRPGPAVVLPEKSDRPLIAICMATFEPRAEWLCRQLESIREQSWDRWICLISDDHSSDRSFGELERSVAADPRFHLSRAPSRSGFYANFERALQMVPPEAELVALADQDDRWDPDKLEALSGALEANPGAALAYSDMRTVSEDGEVLSDTYWYLGSNAYDDIASLIANNTVTGAASLFRRELLAIALPFPPSQSDQHYHDHWLALCALAVGDLAYVDRPTYDYTRHVESVTMQAAPQWFAPPRTAREWATVHWRRWTRRLRMGTTPLGWRAIYFDRYLMIRQLVAVLELRAGGRIEPRKRRALRLFVMAERSPRAAAWLLGRTLRPLIGRNETLGRERVLFGALLWRWIFAVKARRRRRIR